tara:strand:+ start:283 stop:528 length:246 start_codon:yes stop_codon:yes gene_type:complete
MNMNFAVYSKDGCPYCDKIVQLLELGQLKHVVYKLDQHFDEKAFYEEFGDGSTFPQVVVDGKKLGGCSSTANFLQENKLIV